MLLLGIDIGTSFIKVSVVDAATKQCIGSAQYPETEAEIISHRTGWAEQSPLTWWEQVLAAIQKLNTQKKYNPQDIAAIGISYQMHGLVLVDKKQDVLRDSIIWCDSRAVETGDKAFEAIGKQKCLDCLLNSPGNFTASKLAWVKENEPGIYSGIDKMMLPGDFIAMKLTGNITTTISALSEGIFWDFKKDELSREVFDHFGFDRSFIPAIENVFAEHGSLSPGVASSLSLKSGIPVSYKAGDQLNNALSLNVMEPGEFAATAGTSGVIYGITDQLTFDPQFRVNSFAHVNYTVERKRLGVLLCINGSGIMNRWVKSIAGEHLSYEQMNEAAAAIAAGSDGLLIFPFGNGVERMLNNTTPGARINNIDLIKHGKPHLYRAGQEGIAFAFRYGLDIMKESGMQPQLIRAGRSNMFLSRVFVESFVNTLQVPVELYESDGSVGAAIGAGLGAGFFANTKEAFSGINQVGLVEPSQKDQYEYFYQNWLSELKKQLKEPI